MDRPFPAYDGDEPYVFVSYVRYDGRYKHVAEEVINLFLTQESGGTWANVSESKPAWLMHPPGRK